MSNFKAYNLHHIQEKVCDIAMSVCGLKGKFNETYICLTSVTHAKPKEKMEFPA